MTENEPGKFISLAPDLEPQKVEYGDRRHGREEKINQSTLLEEWTKNKELTKEKTFVLGSEELVFGRFRDYGFTPHPVWFWQAAGVSNCTQYQLKRRSSDWAIEHRMVQERNVYSFYIGFG